jgi:hypothetical protein
MAFLELTLHVLSDEVYRHVPRPLDHHLNVMLPSFPVKLAQDGEFPELGRVVRVLDRPGRRPSPRETATS